MDLAEVFLLRASLADMTQIQGYFSWMYDKEKGNEKYVTKHRRSTEWLDKDSPELADGKSYLRFLANKRGYRNNSFTVKRR